MTDRTGLSRGATTEHRELEKGGARIVADLETMEQAERVEDSVKSGYVETIIESILN